jgi:hypothetical protein
VHLPRIPQSFGDRAIQTRSIENCPAAPRVHMLISYNV